MAKRKRRRPNTEVSRKTPPLLPGLGGPSPEDYSRPPQLDRERIQRATVEIIEESGIQDIDEINQILNTPEFQERVMERASILDESPEALAESLVEAARESNDPEEALELCEEALRLDPHCIDAHITRAVLTSDGTAQFAKALQKIIDQAERRFGRKFMNENRGHFWGVLETRPYMRARQLLVETLTSLDRPADAQKAAEVTLELNPNDNQGVRDVLRGLYLQTQSLEKLRKLNKEFDEPLATSYWSRILERFLSGALGEAGALVKEAHSRNKFARRYFSGARRVPTEAPPMYSLGDESEAIVAAILLFPAWITHAEAIVWLKNLP